MNRNVRVSVVQRHAVLDEAAAGDVGKVFNRALRALDKTGYRQCMILTYKPYLLDAAYLMRSESELTRHGVETEFKEWTGPDAGTNFFMALNMGNPCSRKFIVNSDDYPVDDGGVIDAFAYMKEGVLDGHPLAVGQRQRVRLSTDEKLNARRQMHEMLMATLYSDADIQNPFDADLSEVPPAYRRYGDRFSGFYGLNYDDPRTFGMLKRLETAREAADMDITFCAEYLLSLLAAEQETLPITYVPVLQTNPGSRRTEVEINDLIDYAAEQMLRTELGNRLKGHIHKPETVETIARFYPKDDVIFVQQLMLKHGE